MLPITLHEIVTLVQGSVLQGTASLSSIATGVIHDHRKIQPGDVFVAFRGDRVDGHDYIHAAFASGAVAAIVTVPTALDECDSHPVILVGDALQAIQSLARHERQNFSGPVIGVTGSNGKTTTKEMLAAVFECLGECLSTAGNYNNELGLPITILQRKPTHRAIILEMGMRDKGQIAALCGIAEPTAGIITNIGQSHIEILKSQAGIAEAKGELLQAIPKNGGVAVLTSDDDWLNQIADKSPVQPLWYSVSDETADAYATDIVRKLHGIEFTAHVGTEIAQVSLPTYGEHNVRNALGALLMGHAYGLKLQEMAAALSAMSTLSGRLNIISGSRNWTLIDDSYNASPLSVMASLDVLRDLSVPYQRPAVAILGDMYELGDITLTGHESVGAYAAQIGIGTVIAVGMHAKAIADAARAKGAAQVHYFSSQEEALAAYSSILAEGAVVLVKASRGMRMEQTVLALQGK